MKKILAKIFATLIATLSLSAVCSAADTIFMGFDDNKMPSNLKPDNIDEYTISDGIASFKDENSGDSYLTYSCSINADDYDRVIIRIKHELNPRPDSKATISQVFYTGTDANGAALELAEANSVKTGIHSLSTNGEYVVYTVKLDNANLAGATIKTMRFDLVNCKGTFDLDYIMLVPKNPNPDYIFEFDTNNTNEGWGNANLTSSSVNNGLYSGINKAANGLIHKTFPTLLYGGDYPKMYVRQRASGVTSNCNGLIYTDLYDENGTALKSSWSGSYEGYSNVGITNTVANNDKFVLHTFDFTGKTAYMNNYFKYMVLNMVADASASFDVDYVALKNKKSYEWTFDHEEFAEGWTKPAGFSLSGGAMNYTSGDTYANPLFYYDNASIDADSYDGLEIIMKHSLKPDGEAAMPDSTTVQLYYKGTAADGSAIGWAEANSVKADVTTASSGDSYIRYYLDLSQNATWKGATITNLRIDPINANGDASIDFIRLVPNENLGSEALDESLVSVDYEFEDEKAGNADGVITVDIGEQSYDDIKKLTISWADENGTALSDYSIIKAYTQGEFGGTYTINKNMLIPDDAKKIAVAISDVEKTFTVTFDIPENKLPEDLGEPLYTAAFISDIHVGGWGSETAPNARLVAAREQINKYADFVVINGDLTQWYGARSEQEFKKYNYNGSSFGDNGETDTSYLDQNLGVSQWELLTAYFKGFDVPVYPVQGNHDIRDGDGWNEVYYNPDLWLDTFYNWIDYSIFTDGTQSYYDIGFVNDVAQDRRYYDAYIYNNHFIFLEMPKIDAPYYALGEEQLAWLDKKLYDYEASGKPIFVFTHVPMESDLNGGYWDNQLKDDAEFKAILEKHPTAIVVSGHTHYSLDVDAYSSIDGGQDTYSLIHDGGTTTINVPNGTNYDETTEISGSHGVFVEVYDDRILVRGRDFASDKWISKGYTLITMKENRVFAHYAACTYNEQGEYVIAIFNPEDDVTYTFTVDGTEYYNVTEIKTPESFDILTVKATAADGRYLSLGYTSIFELPNDGYPPETLDTKELRINSDGEGVTGAIRFAAAVPHFIKNIDNVEYGFIVTRESFIETHFRYGLFDFEYANNQDAYVYGTAFVAENGEIKKDITNGALDDGKEKITCALTGIDATNADMVNEVMAVRPYIKYYFNGDPMYLYGNIITGSLGEIAKLVDTSMLPDDYKAFVEGVAELAK